MNENERGENISYPIDAKVGRSRKREIGGKTKQERHYL